MTYNLLYSEANDLKIRGKYGDLNRQKRIDLGNLVYKIYVCQTTYKGKSLKKPKHIEIYEKVITFRCSIAFPSFLS